MSNSAFRQPVFLGDSHQPRHRIRCPIHGFIRFSDFERRIIDHPLFRRLRWIRQLALTELVYPGATHTRFEHSLGVMEMATRIFDRMAAENGALIEKVLGQVIELRDDTLAKARQLCRFAALLHDAGHCCFSHAAESVIHRDAGHEALTVKLLKEHEYFGKLLDESCFAGCASLTASLIKPTPTSAPQLRLLRDIVSGQIDADRMDYLLRDSHHCGVDYGRFDHLRLIECLSVWENEDTGELGMAIHRDGVHNFESLILARYQMSTQVYYHRLRRIYDKYLEEYFRCMSSDSFDSTEKVLAWNDVKAMQQLMSDANDVQASGHKWAKRIIERHHHRDVFAIDEKDGKNTLRRAKKVFQRIQEEFPTVEFLADLPEDPFSIHKIARDDDEHAKGDDFPLLDKGRRWSLGDRSQILRSLPASFRVGFIFADVTDRAQRERVSQRCRQISSEVE